ncbi:hypothetical protein C1645_822429 [Glomus cerebriforme]|uniref:Uncharacterized protein n=1 Tax=Glomus cerebriforme TaxID=658196 RepID=A0A397SYV2_9GLOM|nr:hypothetical protein C1645_822429 [Glomus cerebriforme]
MVDDIKLDSSIQNHEELLAFTELFMQKFEHFSSVNYCSTEPVPSIIVKFSKHEGLVKAANYFKHGHHTGRMKLISKTYYRMGVPRGSNWSDRDAFLSSRCSKHPKSIPVPYICATRTNCVRISSPRKICSPSSDLIEDELISNPWNIDTVKEDEDVNTCSIQILHNSYGLHLPTTAQGPAIMDTIYANSLNNSVQSSHKWKAQPCPRGITFSDTHHSPINIRASPHHSPSYFELISTLNIIHNNINGLKSNPTKLIQLTEFVTNSRAYIVGVIETNIDSKAGNFIPYNQHYKGYFSDCDDKIKGSGPSFISKDAHVTQGLDHSRQRGHIGPMYGLFISFDELDYIDSFRELHPNSRTYSYTHDSTKIRIDYIWLSPAFSDTLLKADIITSLDITDSDHDINFSSINFGFHISYNIHNTYINSGQEQQKVYQYDKASAKQWSAYRSQVTELLQSEGVLSLIDLLSPHTFNQNNADRIWDLISSSIQQAADNNILFSLVSNKNLKRAQIHKYKSFYKRNLQIFKVLSNLRKLLNTTKDFQDPSYFPPDLLHTFQNLQHTISRLKLSPLDEFANRYEDSPVPSWHDSIHI